MLGKNKFCDEKLSDLVPVEGGSKCLRCQKILKDFRKNSFSEIEEIQSSENGPHCGIYTRRQIEQWNKYRSLSPFSIGKKSITRMAMLSSLLFSLNPTKASTEIYNPPIKNHQEIGIFDKYPVSRLGNKISVVDTIVIEGVVIDSLTQQPMFATVYIESLCKGAYTDEQGKFRIVIEESVEVSYPLKLQSRSLGYVTKEIKLEKKENHLLQIELMDDGNKGEEVFIGTSFYNPPAPVAKTFWWKVKNVFRRKKTL